MKTAIDQAIDEMEEMEKERTSFIFNLPDLSKAIQILKEYKQTELEQLRAAYNNSCHEISFDEYYKNKYERKEQISPKDMGDNKEA